MLPGCCQPLGVGRVSVGCLSASPEKFTLQLCLVFHPRPPHQMKARPQDSMSHPSLQEAPHPFPHTQYVFTMAKWANLDHHLSLTESVRIRLLVKMFVGSIGHTRTILSHFWLHQLAMRVRLAS